MGAAQSTEAESANWAWLYMSLETATFLIFSAALWLVIKSAETGPAAGAADQTVPPRDRPSEVPELSGQRV